MSGCLSTSTCLSELALSKFVGSTLEPILVWPAFTDKLGSGTNRIWLHVTVGAGLAKFFRNVWLAVRILERSAGERQLAVP